MKNEEAKYKLKALEKVAGMGYGLQKQQTARHLFRTAKIRFQDFEDYLRRTSALLEVCVLALDGEGKFYSKMLSHQDKDSSVKLVLELALELMPHDDISKYQQMIEIMENDLNSERLPDELKELSKQKYHEE